MKIELFPPLFIHEMGMRDNQEDYLWPDLPEEATAENRLYILCDGMGGYEHGEVASKTVCQTIPHVLRRSMSFNSEDLTDDDLLGCLERAYQELDIATTDVSHKMGTTIALLYIGKSGITALHMGDSRIYHIRPNVGILYQSRDHSLASELFQAGEITYEEMLNYPKKNIVTRAMMPGKDNRMHPDIIHITDIMPNDYFYMCSDGMLEQMNNDQLFNNLMSKATDDEKRKGLVELTNNNQDNHSAWIIHVKDVVMENGDDSHENEELTSRCNMIHILPSLGPDEDLVIIKDEKHSFFVNTKMGQIEILEPTDSLLKEIQSILPFGFFPFNESFNGYKFGFVTKCDSDEMRCLKQQPVEVEEKVAHQLIHFHHLLTLGTYIQIKDKIGDSLYYATPYLKNKGDMGYETGIAHFFYPQNMAHEMGHEDFYDSDFGEGATDLFLTFAKTYHEINKASGLNIQYLGLDIRTIAQLGSLNSGFMIYKGNFIYNGAQIKEGDPRFELLANRGVFEIIHMPSAPMEIRRDQLAFAKGKE